MKTRNLLFAITLVALTTGQSYANESDKLKTNSKEVISTNVPEADIIKEKRTIVGVAADNENFSTLVAAVKAAGLVEILNSEGPFTVFAPVNSAFEKLPEGTLNSLLEPDSKDALTSILTYHVVAGKFKASEVKKAIEDTNGKFSIPTVQGGVLVASMSGSDIMLTDEKGNTSTIVISDVKASNGIIHAIDTVVMP